MKLKKIKLNALANAELDERKMCRLLGGGTPGNCQCGCHYENTGGSSTGSNNSSNNAKGLWSDPTTRPPVPTFTPIWEDEKYTKVDGTCIFKVAPTLL